MLLLLRKAGEDAHFLRRAIVVIQSITIESLYFLSKVKGDVLK